MADNGATFDIGLYAPPFLPPQGNGNLPPAHNTNLPQHPPAFYSDERGTTVFLAANLPANEPGGGLAVLVPQKRYLMGGYNTVPRRWEVLGQPDLTGAFYPGPGATPTGISVVRVREV